MSLLAERRDFYIVRNRAGGVSVETCKPESIRDEQIWVGHISIGRIMEKLENVTLGYAISQRRKWETIQKVQES